MARNKVQFQKGMSEAQFGDLYGTEPLCHAALVRWRWPEGFECPDCQGREHCIVKRGARSLYQCNACRKQTSVKAGTIFESSKLPLRLWFKAMYLVTQSKKGISSIELGRRLGVTQTAAWSLKHKLAQVMIERNAAKRLEGEVQMDDAYIGGLIRARRGGQDAFRGSRFRDRRRQTRSDHPSPRCRVHQDCDCQTRGHGARRRRSHRLRCARLFSRRDRGRMHPYPNQDRQRSEGGQKSPVQMGQHRAWQHQGGNGGNLQSRAGQTCAAIPRRIRVPVQPQIPARNHDRQARIRFPQDPAYAVPATEIG